MPEYKLLSVTKSPDPDKKIRATFENKETGRKKVVDAGQAGAPDYTITGDKEQRERYRTRHRKDLETNDPTRPGYLSFFLLWGTSVSLAKNLQEYKRRFNM